MRVNNIWNINTTTNWKYGAQKLVYLDGNGVILDDTASNTTLVVAITVNPNSLTVNNTNKNYTLSGSAISGRTALVKNSSGTLTLVNTNNYTGGTLINDGILQLGDSSSKNGVVTGNITNKGALVFANPNAQTVSGVISGTGTVTKSGVGSLTLTNGNTYSGNTTIIAGTVLVTNGGAINSPMGVLNVGSQVGTAGTSTLGIGGTISVQTLLATNVIRGGPTNSVINLNGGTLTTSNTATAANILIASNASFNINSSWNMNGGTNYLANVQTNGVFNSINIGNSVNNVTVIVNSGAVFNTLNPCGMPTNMTMNIGCGTAAFGNQLIITNGGQVILKKDGTQSGVGAQVGATGCNYNSVLVAGANGAGQNAKLDCGAGRLIIGGTGSGANNWIQVDAGGIITNSSVYSWGGGTNYLIVTNGGQVVGGYGAIIGRSGVGHVWAVAGVGIGGKSTLALSAGDLDIGGANYGNATPGTNSGLFVGPDGLFTNTSVTGRIIVGADTNASGNFMFITNGGQVFSKGTGVIGNTAYCKNNYVSLGGGTNISLWSLGNTNLIIGNNALASNNYVTLLSSGVLTNVSSVVFGGVNSRLNFNGGTLAAGGNGNLNATNGTTTVNANNYVQAGGAVIDSVTYNVVNTLPLLEDPNSTGGGLTKLGNGTLTLLGLNTYTGPTTISAGTLVVNNNATISTGLLNLNGGTLSNNVSCTLTNMVNLNTASTVGVASGQTLIISGVVTNTRNLTVLGAGTLLLNGNGGRATGTVLVTNNTALGGSGAFGGSVFLAAGSSLVPGGLNTVGTFTVSNNLTLNGNTLGFDLSTNAATTNDLVVIGNNLTVNGTNTILISISTSIPAGNYTLMTFANGSSGSGNFVLTGLSSYYTSNATLVVNATNLVLQVGAGGMVYADIWKGYVNGTWDASVLNWTNKNPVVPYVSNDAVIFDDTMAGNSTVTNAMPGAIVSPGSMRFYNNLTNYTLNVNTAGAGSLHKLGLGMVTLTGSNTYSGDTIINAGTLVVTNGGAINSPNATLLINTGTNTLANGGSITIGTLLSTNVVLAGGVNTAFNFTGGTLTTSNSGMAANILLASNTAFNVGGNWNMVGGTNYVTSVQTNGTYKSVVFGLNASNTVVTVSDAVFSSVNPAAYAFSPTNLMSLYVGSGAGGGNVFNITNGGQVYCGSYNGSGLIGFALGITANNANDGLIVAGANAVGSKSRLDTGGGRLYIGNAGSASTNDWVLVDGGIITNVGGSQGGTYTLGVGSSLVITNGGQILENGGGGAVGRVGLANYWLVAGADSAGNRSTFNGGSGALNIGGIQGLVDSAYSGTNNWLWVGQGGLVTNLSHIFVGGNTNALNNGMIITNGGQMFSSGSSSIGSQDNANNNYVSLGGGNNSLWNLGNASLTIGNNALAMNNYATLFTGGVLTNVSAVILGGVNSLLNFNGGTLAAGGNGSLITTNGTTVNATNYVQTGGAVIDPVTYNVVNTLPLMQDPNSLGGGLTKLGSGILTLLGVNTYSGPTLVDAGTLVLTGSASIAGSSIIALSGDSVLDISGLNSAFVLGVSQTLSNSASGAVINGVLNCSSGFVSLVYDGTNASLIITNGTLTLSAGTTFTLNYTGPSLAPGGYKIISNASTGCAGLIVGAAPANPTFSGSFMETPSLQIVNGGLYLVVGGNMSEISYGQTTLIYNGSAQSPTIIYNVYSTGAKTTNYAGIAPTVYGPSIDAPTNVGIYYMTNTVATDGTSFGSTNSTVFIINPVAMVSFSENDPGLAINPAFCGLSYEKSKLTGNLFVSNNAALIALFSQIAPAVLRIGANSVDTTCWGGVSNLTAITPAQVDAFAGFVKALPTNWHVIYGINMSVNSPTNCAAEAAYVANALGDSLLGFEIGNEPDIYRSNGLRPTGYTYSQFLAEWQTFAAAITNSVPGWAITNGGKGWALTGPASANNTSGYTMPFATNGAGSVSLVTQHYFRGNGQSSNSTMALLLSSDSNLPITVSNIVVAATAANLPLGFRMSECGSFYNGGNAVSSQYGAALWTLDFMFINALNGASGVNFHSGGQSFNSYTPIADNGSSVVMARPEFYGLKLFSLASLGGSVLPATVTLETNFNFAAYGVLQANGVMGAVLINKETNYSVQVKINLGSNVITASSMILTGPDLYSTNGYTLGGTAINADGSWGGGLQSTSLTTNGQLIVTVPPITALWLNSATNMPPEDPLPSVSITSPVNNYVAPAGTNISILTTFFDRAGISKIEFYNGTNKLGMATAEPFSLVWSNVTSGVYLLTAQAIDKNDLGLTSSVVRVIIDDDPYHTDRDGDGVIDIQEYFNGTDPVDYYNGNLPIISVVSGNRQMGLTNDWLAMPIIVQLTDTNSTVLTNAPLNFSVAQGQAMISVSSNGATSSLLELRTDHNGQAVVWMQLPSGTGVNIVTVSAHSGTNVAQASFYEVAKTSGMVPMMAVGVERIMRLTTNGDVVSWGGNQYGGLGDYTHLDSSNPVQVVGLTNIVNISAGVNHSLAIDACGMLWAWGDNQAGQLGSGGTNGSNVPVPVLGMTNGVAGAAGGYWNSVAVKTDGTVWQWGNWSSNPPTLVPGLTNAIAVSAGYGHMLALLNDGTVWAWGDDTYNQLGDGSENYSYIPVQVPELSNIVAISAGGYHSLALDSNSEVWAWGLNTFGQLGNDQQGVGPSMIADLTNIVSIAAGNVHSLAVDRQGRLWAWGDDSRSQFGDGGLIGSSSLPLQVSGMTNLIFVVAGSDASIALAGDGNLLQWGVGDRNNNAWPWGDEMGYPVIVKPFVDFYQGQLPILSIMGGNYQAGHADLEFELPLVVQVTDTNGVALSNAPVSVEVIAGDMELRTVSGGDIYKGLRLTTGVNGQVSLIGYADRYLINTNCLIRVLAASRAQIVEANFNETLVPVPVISITSPGNGSTCLIKTNQPLPIMVNAQAGPGASIQKVEYSYQFNGGDIIPLGISTQSPFSFTWTNSLWWTNAFLGQYTLTAVAVDNAGARSDPQSVNITMALDSVGIGIPDYWQLQYFGQVGVDTNSAPDGNGQSLLYDFQNGIDPTDYYNGTLPTLKILGGNYQAGKYDSFLPLPLKIKVTAQNKSILTNAPVLFTVSNGTALLALTTNDAPITSLALRTDANGQASVWIYFPPAGSSPPDSTILVSASSGANSTSVAANEFVPLAHWTFNDTNSWIGEAGQMPLFFTNVIGVPSWSSNAVAMDSSNPALLAYNVVETDGQTNINCNNGSILFWFRPNWSSTNAGGYGPGNWGRLIEIGSYDPTFTNSWWSLYLSPSGTQLLFGTATNGIGMTNVNADISWLAGEWYQIALTYSPTGSSLYVNGQLLASGTGVTNSPNTNDLANGFRIGSDQSGGNQARGTFDELVTFGYPLAPGNTASFSSALPDWWGIKYFGTNGINPYASFNGSGITLLSDYLNGVDPSHIFAVLHLPLEPTTTNSVNGTISILAGWPAYVAVLVNDTNQANAVWQPYNPSLTPNLNQGNGLYNVLVGLRGWSTNAQIFWQSGQVALNAVSLAMTITNPIITSSAATTVAQSVIQLQGYANVPLGGLTYDLSNASGVVTNLTGYVTGWFYDTNLQTFTGNSFQCYDVPLTNGWNTITLHATDMAGNTATTNVSLIMDYTSYSNGGGSGGNGSNGTIMPVLSVAWPTDGISICGTNFTISGQVDDPTATITVIIVDANGYTNTVAGRVDRDGTVRVNNVPLAAGANMLTVTAKNAVGNSASTSLTLNQSSVLVTLNPPTGDLSTVSGTVSDNTVQVYVNGVAATVNPDGTWTASGVPVSATGTVVYEVVVYPAANPPPPSMPPPPPPSGGGGTLTASLVRANTLAMNNTLATLGINKLTAPTGPVVQVVGYQENDAGESYSPLGGSRTGNRYAITDWSASVNWTEGVGGTYHNKRSGKEWFFYYWMNQGNTEEQIILMPENPNYNIPMEHGNIGWPQEWSGTVAAKTALKTGGDDTTGKLNLYLVRLWVYDWWYDQVNYYGDDQLYINPAQVTVPGRMLVPDGVDTNANDLLVMAPDRTTVEMTPQTSASDAYSFSFQPIKLDLQLAVDNNRDGTITFDRLGQNNPDQTTVGKPFRFWINDSRENGDIVAGADCQIPGQPALSPNNEGLPYANYAYDHVQARSDLVNYFPVALNLSDTLTWLSPTNGYEYHLVQGDSAVKFVYTSLTLTNAIDYLTNTASTGYGSNANENAESATTILVPGLASGVLGVTLDTNWLARVQANGGTGIILVEGCTNTIKPLWLEIWHKDQSGNNKMLGGVPLYLNISGVEQMFRHKNLRDGNGEPPSGLVGDTSVRDNVLSQLTRINEPTNNPDADSNGNWFIFVVGSNVDGDNARGWEAEMFKRLYWSGSKAKFVGVSWYGDPFTDGEGVYDYHMAVRNAFGTAPALASFVNGLSGSKTIAGHSLGCGLIAAAMADHGMTVNNACLFDSAFAQECFDGDADDNLTAMRPAAWENYPESLWAAHSHERFDSSDARSTLTWRNRFVNALNNGNVYNFYSSTEDCLGEYDGEVPSTAVGALINSGFHPVNYVWVYQEKAKGNRQDYYIPIYPGSFHAGSKYGGWGFNPCDGYLPSYPVWYKLTAGGLRTMKTPADIGTPTQAVLDGSQCNPLFKNGWGTFNGNNPSEIYVNANVSQFTGPTWILGLYQPNQGSTVASDPVKCNQLLAEMIPALSLPAGANHCGNLLSGRQFNMPEQFIANDQWPRAPKPGMETPVWWHSDMDQVAYPYLYKLYNQLVSISNQ